MATMQYVALPFIFAFAFLIFGLTGFGSALVAMPLLSPLLGIGTAAPLFALVSLTGESVMLYRNRHQLNIRAVWRLIVASFIAVPIGITAASSLDEHVVLLLLGILVGGYGLYGLLSPHLPEIKNPNWGFGFGFTAGLLSGAYNTGGPPIVIYGNLSRWSPGEFKSNLQSAFILNSLLIVSIHTLSGHITATVLQDALLGWPAMLLGLMAGWRLEAYINPQLFRKIVLALLVVIGGRLLLTNWPG